MKRLYPIILILLITACRAPQTGTTVEELLPTTPAEWLTNPPTPIISQDALQASPKLTGADLDTGTASPTPVSASSQSAAEATPVPTGESGFDLPRLYGRQWTVSAEAGVPDEIITAARALAADRPDDFLWVEPGSLPTDITIRIDAGEPLAKWLYVAAAPFPTLEDNITDDELAELWQTSNSTDRALFLSKDVAALLRGKWGQPGDNVSTVANASLSQMLWDKRPSLTILPFHQLKPDLKVLQLNGISPFSSQFDSEGYPLELNIGIDGEEEALTAFLGVWEGAESNFDPHKLTTLAMTGVTALVRATAAQMEIDGILSPAIDVGPVLHDVDFAHISNEVSFDAACPDPSPVGGTSFCSKDEYFALLKEIGTDIIELTGNHLNDYGVENVGRTIDMYEEAGMDYFGGGRDAEDAQRAAIIEHNGNRIAMVGCNYFGPVYAWATDTTAGSRACGPGFYEQISQLKDEGHVVIATQQYTEYYQYEPTPDQQRDFRTIAEAGAAAVSGSQGHHAQGFDFHNGAFIHYGLGNLFFDQMDMLGTRQAFVDIYSIYDGRLLNIDLWTGLIINYSVPREMTAAEREDALKSVFAASGW